MERALLILDDLVTLHILSELKTTQLLDIWSNSMLSVDALTQGQKDRAPHHKTKIQLPFLDFFWEACGLSQLSSNI